MQVQHTHLVDSRIGQTVKQIDGEVEKMRISVNKRKNLSSITLFISI